MNCFRLLPLLLSLAGCDKTVLPPVPAAQAPPDGGFRFEVSKLSRKATRPFLDMFGEDIRNQRVNVMVEGAGKSPGSNSIMLRAEVPYDREKISMLLHQLKNHLVTLALETGAAMPVPVEITLDGEHWTGFTMRYAEGGIEGSVIAISVAIEHEKYSHQIQITLDERTQ